MKNLFPIQIQENSIQSHWVKRNSKSRAIYTIILFALLSLMIALPFIQVDITIQSKGIIRTPNERNSLQAAISGQIERVDIYENKEVIRGDTLLWLRTDEINERISRLSQKKAENQDFVDDIENLLKKETKNIISPKYRTENNSFRSKLSELEVSIQQLRYEYNISKKLYDKGIEARYEFQKKESLYKQARSQRVLLKEEQENLWQTEKTRLEFEIKDIDSQIKQLFENKRKYQVIAPETGTIIQYIGLQAGNFTVAGQNIAQITSSENLIVECFIGPGDIGYIYEGQKVKFLFDAFNYQQWGVVSGSIIELIPDIIELDNKPYFRARCSLDKNYLELPNGYKGYLKKGMTNTVRCFLTRRSLWQLLFDKINDWMNPKIMENEYKN